MAFRTYFLWIAIGLLHTGCATLRLRSPLHSDIPSGTWYVVKPGETATQIADHAGIPLEDLLEANGIGPRAVLEPGRLLFIFRETPIDPSTSALGAPNSGEQARSKNPDLSRFNGKFQWPIKRPILTSPFGSRWGRHHDGIDIAASIGTPILAAASGVVLYAGDRVKGYGHMIVLQHSDGIVSVYAHNSALRVRTGDKVEQGQEIALAGDSGRSTAPHLHFEIRRGELPEDPIPFLPPLK